MIAARVKATASPSPDRLAWPLPGNSIAPGPVWTPLILATFDAEKVSSFDAQVPIGRAAHPDEIAPCYVFFASGRLSS